MAIQSKRFDKQPGTCLQFISTSMSSSKVERGKFSLGFSSKSMGTVDSCSIIHSFAKLHVLLMN